MALALTLLAGPRAAEARARFEPPEGRTLVIVGQDLETIQAYADAVGVPPGGVMVYTSIQRLEGVTEPADHGSGIQHAQALHERFPQAVIQIGFYMVDALEDTAAGRHDERLDRLAAWITETGVPVFLRVGYEFDGPHNRYEPRAYVAAYRHVVDRLREKGAANAAFVWHAYGAPAARPLEAWYPGDAYVDWVGVSYFNQPQEMAEPAVAFARARGKPVMLAEATPRGTLTLDGELAWKAWFDEVFAFIERHDIEAFSYINSHWEAQPMWRGQDWGDARVQAHPFVLEAWRGELAKPRYLHGSPQLFKLLEVDAPRPPCASCGRS